MTGHPLHRLLRLSATGDAPPFALLHRPEHAGADVLEVLTGEVSTPDTLSRLPRRERPDGHVGPWHDVLTVVPFRQVAERGYDCADDGAPLIALTVREQAALSLSEVLPEIPLVPVALVGGHFDLDDDAYAEVVGRIVADEIGQGEGANFVIKRTYVAEIAGYRLGSALSFFRRLVEREKGAYWTFLVHTGDRVFVGASPERHVSLHGGTAVMNPISGTYRYPAAGPTLGGVLDFLADTKEIDELYMTVDEELKMMSRVCHDRVRVVGPHLKEMARLAHTEYLIEGSSDRDPREVLAMTLFAPTVTGSPVESACKVIRRYEPEGRGYYSGVVALIGTDADGRTSMDSAIMIRTAEIGPTGLVRIGVGATLVRDSDPVAEAAETRGKAAGLLAALDHAPPSLFAQHPRVRAALAGRNTGIAGYWLARDEDADRPRDGLAGRRVLVVDAEDTFTSMIAHQLRSTGMDVLVRRHDEPFDLDGHDLVVLGPGPGDPREHGHPKITRLRSSVRWLLEHGRPFLAVCLSHQVLATALGLPLRRRTVPNQGVRREVDLFGRTEQVGFYNTFAARSESDEFLVPGIGPVSVSRDPLTGEVYAMVGPSFASTQFHAESVLTRDGVRITSELVLGVLDRVGAAAELVS
ncbi:chorismate-binding protein [Actinokineospora globicatena]|uniref:chorismate-binding protein n=1 Tax=Actinokineospora globicatena TaxID=103729 RepID=UPI0020A23981|nr:chorismate-binding protein [Actinokineospora globicatena]MCP2303159.1 phenazine biosynthesis protein phzE [Actinokineospora globicatena]GLW79724.1 phenazine-specific anthranilate synthase component I [Actinokineospora globicatena]GLW85866.1 phenazine-specific anthranilate synthase component I [Actinokineospora globicatena]